jgi:hypothetical protein
LESLVEVQEKVQQDDERIEQEKPITQKSNGKSTKVMNTKIYLDPYKLTAMRVSGPRRVVR